MHSSTRLLALLALIPLAACRSAFNNSVAGDGHVITVDRQGVAEFDRIEVFGGMRLDIEVGGPASVRVETDSNLQSFVTTEVSGGVLEVGHRENLSPSETILVTISVPSLRAIDASGGIRIDVRGVDADSFAVECSGSLAGSVQGRATSCEVDTSGAMKLDLSGLAVQDMDVDISGAGDLRVSVEKKLDVSVSGSASIGYRGQPAVSLSQSGSARVYALE